MSCQFVDLGDSECSDHVNEHDQVLLLGLLLPTNVAHVNILLCTPTVGGDGCGRQINLGKWLVLN